VCDRKDASEQSGAILVALNGTRSVIYDTVMLMSFMSASDSEEV
jgi:hypothetical protein